MTQLKKANLLAVHLRNTIEWSAHLDLVSLVDASQHPTPSNDGSIFEKQWTQLKAITRELESVRARLNDYVRDEGLEP